MERVLFIREKTAFIVPLSVLAKMKTASGSVMSRMAVQSKRPLKK